MNDGIYPDPGGADEKDAGKSGSTSGLENHPANYDLTPLKWKERENKRLKTALALETGVIVLGILLLFLVIPAAIGGQVMMPSAPMSTELVRGGDSENHVALIPVAGVIQSGRTGPGDRGGSADWIVDAIKDATEDPKVKAIILEVESPGGSITASDLVHREVGRAQAEGRKVVAFFGSLAASGGYYVSAGADKIIAQPTSITGSVGVILQTFRVNELFRKIGVEAVTIKSGKYKDMGSMFRDIKDEEREMLQEMADEAHRRFVSIVADGRGMSMDRAGELADGRILTATQAEKLGLVDDLGYLDEAIEAAESLAGITDATVVRYRQPPSLMDLFAVRSGSANPGEQIAEFLSGMGPAYLMDSAVTINYLTGKPIR